MMSSHHYCRHAWQVSDAAAVHAERAKGFSDIVRPDAMLAGCAALHYAVLAHSRPLVDLLLAAQADPNLRVCHISHSHWCGVM